MTASYPGQSSSKETLSFCSDIEVITEIDMLGDPESEARSTPFMRSWVWAYIINHFTLNYHTAFPPTDIQSIS